MLTQRPAAPYFINHAPGMGVIARYHLDKATIDSQLASIRTATDGISLSLWLMKGAVALGAGDQYLDWSGGQLTPQMQANLINLLASIKTRGFNWVQIAPQFYGANDPRQQAWVDPQPSYYVENWQFIASLPAMCEAAGLEYLIDVCPEVNDVYLTNPGLQSYAKRLWVDVTSWFYPNGRPCWNFSMSFIPSNLSVLISVFQGNWPEILLPHVYTNEGGGLGAELSWLIGQIPAGIRPWILGETDTLQPGDEAVAQQLAAFIETTKQPIIRVCPWPVTPRTATGVQIDAAVVPQIAPVVWTGVGA